MKGEKMKKLLTVLLITTILLTGCTTSKSYTYDVDNGDRIKITIDTSNGYDMTSGSVFEITKDKKVLSNAMLIKGEYYQKYMNAAKEQGQIYEESSNNNIDYIFYTVTSESHSEYNYIIKIKNSNTGLIIGNANSKEEAETCFKLLSFEVVK